MQCFDPTNKNRTTDRHRNQIPYDDWPTSLDPYRLFGGLLNEYEARYSDAISIGSLSPFSPNSSRPVKAAMSVFNITLSALKSSHPSAQELYAGTDFSQLSWIEQQWAAWYLWVGDPVLATGIMSFLMHEVCLHAYRTRYRRLTSPCRLSTLDVPSPGSSSTRSRTSVNGRFNR